MEEDVKPEDEDGVDGRGGCGWDERVCGLDAMGASLAFGLVRGAGAFAAVLPFFALVSRMPFAQRYRGNATSFRAASSSRREAMVGGALARASVFRVGLGVGGTVIAPGFRARPFALVSRMPFAQRYRDNATSFSAASSSRREAMVGGTLARASALRVGLGVGGAAVVSGSRARPSHSCASDFCFSFKNAARATIPWLRPLPQRSVFNAT